MTENAEASRGGFVRVALTRGFEAIVDETDLHLVAGVTWHPLVRRGTTYAYGTIDGKQITMHRLVMNSQPGQIVDHINGDGLDNRRSVNLRFCTHAENIRNQARRRSARKVSKFKGVSYARGRWAVGIEQNGARVHLGTYTSEEQAARVYDAAAKVFFGRFARTNVDLGLLAPQSLT